MARIAFGEIYSGTVALVNGTVEVVESTSTLGADKIIGSVRSSIDATLKIYQNPVTVSETTHWLKVTDIALTASEASGGGQSVSVDITGPGGAKIDLVAAATGTALVDLHVRAAG